MTKNIYRISQYDAFSTEDAFLYLEAEDLKDALLKYLDERWGLNRDEIIISGLSIKKIKIKNHKASAKNMKNRTVLK